MRLAPKVRRGELQEFLRHVVTHGFSADDFHITAHDAVSPSGRKPGRVISIHRQQYGRDFAVVPNEEWVTAALRALRDGHFGRP